MAPNNPWQKLKWWEYAVIAMPFVIVGQAIAIVVLVVMLLSK